MEKKWGRNLKWQKQMMDSCVTEAELGCHCSLPKWINWKMRWHLSNITIPPPWYKSSPYICRGLALYVYIYFEVSILDRNLLLIIPIDSYLFMSIFDPDKPATASCRSEVRKWTQGSYTLVHDTDSEGQEFALDTMLFCSCKGELHVNDYTSKLNMDNTHH